MIESKLKDLKDYTDSKLDVATETKAGIITEARIKEIAPQPDLTPYVPFSKGFKNHNNTDWFVRTNGWVTWGSNTFEMYNGDNNQFMGAFHTNGLRAYYKVPNRNGENFNEIMDNHDMAVRDNRMNGMDADRNDLRNYVNQINADRTAWEIRDMRLTGFILEQGPYERNGYVVTMTNNLENNTVQYGRRALQFYRNGQWLNVPFA